MEILMAGEQAIVIKSETFLPDGCLNDYDEAYNYAEALAPGLPDLGQEGAAKLVARAENNARERLLAPETWRIVTQLAGVLETKSIISGDACRQFFESRGIGMPDVEFAPWEAIEP
jgi:hypothetical protein